MHTVEPPLGASVVPIVPSQSVETRLTPIRPDASMPVPSTTSTPRLSGAPPAGTKVTASMIEVIVNGTVMPMFVIVMS